LSTNEADYSSQSSAEVKNRWSYTFTSPRTFMACTWRLGGPESRSGLCEKKNSNLPLPGMQPLFSGHLSVTVVTKPTEQSRLFSHVYVCLYACLKGSMVVGLLL